MDKEFIKNFSRWLDSASLRELNDARRKALELISQLHDIDVINDCHLVIRLIDEEIVSRSDLSKIINGDNN